MEILEDLMLARRVKLAGLRQRVAIAPGMVSLHWAAGAVGVVHVMTKNLFAVFRFRIALVPGSVRRARRSLPGTIRLPGLPQTRVSSDAHAGLRWPRSIHCRRAHSKISPWYAFLFPAGAAMFLYSLLRSALMTLRAGGVTWRGTFYPLADLRKNITPLR